MMRRAYPFARSLRYAPLVGVLAAAAGGPAEAQDEPTRVAAALTTREAIEAREELSTLLRAMETQRSSTVPTFSDVIWPTGALPDLSEPSRLRPGAKTVTPERKRLRETPATSAANLQAQTADENDHPVPAPRISVRPSFGSPPVLPRPRPLTAAPAKTPRQTAIATPKPNPIRVAPTRSETPKTPVVPPPSETETVAVGTSDDAAEPATAIASFATTLPPPETRATDASDSTAHRLARAAGAVLATPARAEPVLAGSQPEPDTPGYDGPRPHQLVRILTTLQDDMARGSKDALTAQRILLDRMKTLFLSVPDAIWREPVETRSLVIYALSGGSPEVVRSLRERGLFEGLNDTLLRGALAYIEGRANDAKRILEPVDIAKVDVSVRGALALSLATILLQEDPARAQALLSHARHAAPATLVEEAALRRATIVAASQDDVQAFMDATNRYLRKFRSSIYAGNFRTRLASSLTRMRFLSEPHAFEKLAEILAPMSDAGRRELYLLLARSALEEGDHKSARKAAMRALATAPEGSLDALRGTLYRAAADVVNVEAYDQAIATLSDLPPERLPASDRTLRLAALMLSRNVAALPSPDADAPAPTGPHPTDDTDEPFGPSPDLTKRMAEVFAAVDPLLTDIAPQ